MIAYLKSVKSSERAKRMLWSLIIMAIAYFVILRGDHFLIPPTH